MFYDLLLRKSMAVACERKTTDLQPFMIKIDQDILSQAKKKNDNRIQNQQRDLARFSGGKNNGKEQKGKSTGGKGKNQWFTDGGKGRDNNTNGRSRSPRHVDNKGNGKGQKRDGNEQRDRRAQR